MTRAHLGAAWRGQSPQACATLQGPGRRAVVEEAGFRGSSREAWHGWAGVGGPGCQAG